MLNRVFGRAVGVLVSSFCKPDFCKLGFLAAFALCAALCPLAAQGQNAVSSVQNPPPKSWDELGAPSQPIRLLFTPLGQQAAALHPGFRGLSRQLGFTPSSSPSRQTGLSTTLAPLRTFAQATTTTSTSTCDTSVGNAFNLAGLQGAAEIGVPLPQNDTSIDFIPGGGISGADLVVGTATDYRGFGDSFIATSDQQLPFAWGFGLSGYYVRRTQNTCGADFEGALPTTLDQGFLFTGLGSVSLAADAVRGNVVAADLRASQGGGAVVGLFRTNAAILDQSQTCPAGTHLTDQNGNSTTAAMCWPIAFHVTALDGSTPDRPQVSIDQRAKGVGAGDVYVVWVVRRRFFFRFFSKTIHLTACPANFASPADCSGDTMISALGDSTADLPSVSVRSDGVVTITYTDVGNELPNFQFGLNIQYVSCTPNGAPLPPTCSSPTVVASEDQPLPLVSNHTPLAANDFPAPSFPVHAARWNGSQFEEFVVWPRCKTSPFIPLGPTSQLDFARCSDADVVMTWSSTDSSGNPLGWAPVTAVNDSARDQIMPWIAVDDSSNDLSIGYYTAQNDFFGHELQVFRSRISPGSFSPVTDSITSVLIDPAADWFLQSVSFGDHLGMATRAGRSYLHFTSTADKGLLNGILVPGQRNLIREPGN
jgi:hypothetical protein